MNKSQFNRKFPIQCLRMICPKGNHRIFINDTMPEHSAPDWPDVERDEKREETEHGLELLPDEDSDDGDVVQGDIDRLARKHGLNRRALRENRLRRGNLNRALDDNESFDPPSLTAADFDEMENREDIDLSEFDDLMSIDENSSVHRKRLLKGLNQEYVNMIENALGKNFEFQLREWNNADPKILNFNMERLLQGQYSDPELHIIRSYLSQNGLPGQPRPEGEEFKGLHPRMKSDLRKGNYYVDLGSGLIMYKYAKTQARLIVLPTRHRRAFLQFYHTVNSVHVGAETLANELIRRFYWSGYWGDIKAICCKLPSVSIGQKTQNWCCISPQNLQT